MWLSNAIKGLELLTCLPCPPWLPICLPWLPACLLGCLHARLPPKLPARLPACPPVCLVPWLCQPWHNTHMLAAAWVRQATGPACIYGKSLEAAGEEDRKKPTCRLL